MDISMDIHGKSVDMDMNGKFHIRGKPGNATARLTNWFKILHTAVEMFVRCKIA